jgi:hypothetical protein
MPENPSKSFLARKNNGGKVHQKVVEMRYPRLVVDFSQAAFLFFNTAKRRFAVQEMKTEKYFFYLKIKHFQIIMVK